jgi:hypothetical protein
MMTQEQMQAYAELRKHYYAVEEAYDEKWGEHDLSIDERVEYNLELDWAMDGDWCKSLIRNVA